MNNLFPKDKLDRLILYLNELNPKNEKTETYDKALNKLKSLSDPQRLYLMEIFEKLKQSSDITSFINDQKFFELELKLIHGSQFHRPSNFMESICLGVLNFFNLRTSSKRLLDAWDTTKASLTDLASLKKMPTQERIELLKKLIPNTYFLDKYSNFIEKSDDGLLSLFKLSDLINEDQKTIISNSGLRFAMMNDQEISKLTLKEVEDLTPNSKQIILMRIRNIKNESPSVLKAYNLQNLSILELHHLTHEELNKYVDNTPVPAYSLMEDKQLISLLSSRPDKQLVDALFPGKDLKKDQRRINLISAEQLNHVLNLFSSYQLSLIPDEMLSTINPTRLPKESLYNLVNINTDKERTERKERMKKRFEILVGGRVNQFIEKFGNSDLLCSLIPLGDLSSLDPSKVSNKIMHKIIYTSNLEESKERFFKLTNRRINEFLPKLNPYLLSLIPYSFLSELSPGQLTSAQLVDLFNKDINLDDGRRKFNMLTKGKDRLALFIGKLSPFHVKYIADDEYKELDPNIVPQSIKTEFLRTGGYKKGG